MKSHIIPKALTRRPDKGLPFAQTGPNYPPIKRWDSWYDTSIVTRAGEDILEEIDNAGIEELRRHKLVWSSWGNELTLQTSDFKPMPTLPRWGIREIKGIDGKQLRLFFLSILWRAAVSDMVEFAEVDIRSSDIRRLRRMLLNRHPVPMHLFPLSLTQISTRGDVHNLTPLAQRKPRDPLKQNGPTIPIFRFYFDGLIAHFHRQSSEAEVAQLGPMLVGNSEELVIPTVTFEESWQLQNLNLLKSEAETQWPDRLARINGFHI